MDLITKYIGAEYAVLVAVLYLLGRGLKAVSRFPNQYIPLTLTACGILLACLSVYSRSAEYMNGAAALFDAVVQGILCTGMSVYVNEVLAHCRTGSCAEKDRRDDWPQ